MIMFFIEFLSNRLCSKGKQSKKISNSPGTVLSSYGADGPYLSGSNIQYDPYIGSKLPEICRVAQYDPPKVNFD